MVRSQICEGAAPAAIVDFLLEDNRVCGVCAKEAGDPGRPGQTHGYCRRHYHAALVDSGLPQDTVDRLVSGKPDEAFCPDTGRMATV